MLQLIAHSLWFSHTCYGVSSLSHILHVQVQASGKKSGAAVLFLLRMSAFGGARNAFKTVFTYRRRRPTGPWTLTIPYIQP